MADIENKNFTRMLKLLALAKHGEGGEKENARAMLEKELRKVGVTQEELEAMGSGCSKHFICTPKKLTQREIKVAVHLCTWVCDGRDIPMFTRRGQNGIGCECSAEEFRAIAILLPEALKYYGRTLAAIKRRHRQELDISADVFIVRNDFVGVQGGETKPKRMTDTLREAIRNVGACTEDFSPRTKIAEHRKGLPC